MGMTPEEVESVAVELVLDAFDAVLDDYMGFFERYEDAEDDDIELVMEEIRRIRDSISGESPDD